MNITLQFTRKVKYVSSLFILLLTATMHLHAASNVEANNQPSVKQGKIVVSIKPLYSLVAQLTKGIEKPELLMTQSQSPHHYNLRPSTRRLLDAARMIIWFGPEMEVSLNKVIQQNPTKAVSVMQAENLQLLKNRTRHSSHNEHSTDEHTLGKSDLDPHIWLSTHNAVAISRYISKQLIAHDIANTQKYQANLKQLIEKIENTAAFISATLKENKHPFIAYHDAFQYFENENKLNYIAAISTDDEAGISLHHMRIIKTKIKENQINCLVYQPPKPAIIDTLSQQTSMKIAMLDVLGTTLENNENAWFEIMRSLAVEFEQCLSEG